MAFTRAHARIAADMLNDEQRTYLRKLIAPAGAREVVFHLAPVEMLKELARLDMLKWSKKLETYVLTGNGKKVAEVIAYER